MTNWSGVQNITPTPNDSVKAGAVFDAYRGVVPGYQLTVNPAVDASHLINAQIRFDVARYFQNMGSTGLSFVANIVNLTNNALWLPDLGGGTGDTIPVNRSRTFYVGAELSLNRLLHGSSN